MDAEPGGGIWPRLKALGLVRILIVVAGGTAIAIGLINAVLSEASTAPLIAGALLIIAALLIAPGWREIRARHGETEIAVLRGVESRLEVATSEGKTEAELRAEIVELKADVQRAREAVESGDVPASTGSRHPPVYEATHTISNGKVILTLGVPPSGGLVFDSFRCVVRDPDRMTASSRLLSAPIAILPTRREVTLIYPDDFDGAEPLKPGTYLAEWRRRNPLTGSVSALMGGDPVVARDTWG